MFVKKTKYTCRWRVRYKHMAYDGGGSASWDQYYWTWLGAQWSRFLHSTFRSWGGSTTVERMDEDGNPEHPNPH